MRWVTLEVGAENGTAGKIHGLEGGVFEKERKRVEETPKRV